MHIASSTLIIDREIAAQNMPASRSIADLHTISSLALASARVYDCSGSRVRVGDSRWLTVSNVGFSDSNIGARPGLDVLP